MYLQPTFREIAVVIIRFIVEMSFSIKRLTFINDVVCHDKVSLPTDL